MAGADSVAEYPVGLVDFSATCGTVGTSTVITIYYDQVYDTSSWSYKKYTASTTAYSDITDLVTFSIASVGINTVTTVSFTATDGDVRTDEDGVVPTVCWLILQGSAVSISTSSSGGGGGGTRYVCKDKSASNYKSTGKEDNRLCKYCCERFWSDIRKDRRVTATVGDFVDTADRIVVGLFFREYCCIIR